MINETKMSSIHTALSTAATYLNRVVGSTMGPNGYNVSIMHQQGMAMRVTKDGATVADNCHNEDIDINGFIKSITEVAKSVESEVGDGTTTATIMSTSIINDLLTLTHRGHHPRALIKQMDKVLNSLIELHSQHTRECTESKMGDIAMVSSNHDSVMANMVIDIVNSIGAYGRFRCTTGIGDRDFFTTTNGYTIDTGVVSTTLLDNPSVPCTVSGNLVSLNRQLTLADFSGENAVAFGTGNGHSIIICDGLNEDDTVDILSFIAANDSKYPGNRIIPIELSATPMIRHSQINDINAITPDVMTVTIERNRTTFHFDACDATMDYISSVEESVSTIASGFDLEIHKERLQRLRGGYATVMASGTTSAEAKERRDRIDDAILAAQSALREGYVIGGGNHYLLLAKLIKDVPEHLVDVVNNYLESVYRRVHHNSGVEVDVLTSMIANFDVTGTTVIECIKFDGELTKFPTNEYPIIDSAGTPHRVFQATRSLMHTLLPINQHIEFSPTKFVL